MDHQDTKAPSGEGKLEDSKTRRDDNGPVLVPREEWRGIMRELRDFRVEHAALQGKLAKIIGALSEYAAIPQPINHSDELTDKEGN